MADAIEHGRTTRGTRCPTHLLTEDMVRAIRASDKSSSQLARELGVALNTVWKARKGITWGHVK
jgi:hypothetical protein